MALLSCLLNFTASLCPYCAHKNGAHLSCSIIRQQAVFIFFLLAHLIAVASYTKTKSGVSNRDRFNAFAFFSRPFFLRSAHLVNATAATIRKPALKHVFPAIIILLSGPSACGALHQHQQNRDFEILDATAQEWISGVQGGGSSINYKLSIKMLTDGNVVFDSMWAAGKKLKLKAAPATDTGITVSEKNSHFLLFASAFTAGSAHAGKKEAMRENPAAEKEEKAPFEYKGSALLKYLLNGEAKYFEVRGIKVLPIKYGQ